MEGNIGDSIGNEARQGVAGSSQGECLRYVGNAVQRALGQVQSQHIGINSAKDSAPFFTSRGYEEIEDPSKYKNGDIVIMEGSPKHPHGHVQVYYNGKWYSDFAQNGFYPYKDGSQPDYSTYRYIE